MKVDTNIKAVVAMLAEAGVRGKIVFGRLVILDADSGRRLRGFMAQEIETVLPSAATTTGCVLENGRRPRAVRLRDWTPCAETATPSRPAGSRGARSRGGRQGRRQDRFRGSRPAPAPASAVRLPHQARCNARRPAVAKPKPPRDEKLTLADCLALVAAVAATAGPTRSADGLPAAIEAGDDQPAGRRGRRHRRNRGPADDAAAEERRPTQTLRWKLPAPIPSSLADGGCLRRRSGPVWSQAR